MIQNGTLQESIKTNNKMIYMNIFIFNFISYPQSYPQMFLCPPKLLTFHPTAAAG